jgi:predicted  nucleic acid-binding Zn-ribbon protein
VITCTRCSHTWNPKSTTAVVRRCPKCKSPYFASSRQVEQHYYAREGEIVKRFDTKAERDAWAGFLWPTRQSLPATHPLVRQWRRSSNTQA